MRSARLFLTVAAAVALVYGAAAPPASAARLADAAMFFEINDTDGDAGIQLFLDGEGWRRMKVFDPDGNKILDFQGKGSIGLQGITELFFESAEPSFDVQSLEELLGLFPEGLYRFRGTTSDGRPLNGKARLTHHLPGAPLLVSPVDGEAVDPENAVFEWVEVADPPGSEIVAYEVIIGCEEADALDFFAEVGPDVTSITAPPELLGQGGEECKWEVLALEESGNKTISETEFSIE